MEKHFIACALTHKAYIMAYLLSRLSEDLVPAHTNDHHIKVLQQMARIHVLVLDDWTLTPITMPQ